jgi:hypothetical protein
MLPIIFPTVEIVLDGGPYLLMGRIDDGGFENNIIYRLGAISEKKLKR